MMENNGLENLSKLLEDSSSASLLTDDNISTLYGIAYQLYSHGKYEDARQFFRFLTIARPFDRRFWMGLAASYQMQKNYPAAIECYSVAAIQEPTDPYVHWHAATCFFASEQTDKGLQALDSALGSATKESHSGLISQIELLQQAWSGASNNNRGER